jgi:hypothetical protein
MKPFSPADGEVVPASKEATLATDTESSHETIGPMVDLVYSPDDDASSGRGYYFHRYKPRDETSQLFANREDALKAFAANKVRWEA